MINGLLDGVSFISYTTFSGKQTLLRQSLSASLLSSVGPTIEPVVIDVHANTNTAAKPYQRRVRPLAELLVVCVRVYTIATIM